LHGIADRFTPEHGFTRPRWDFQGLIGDAPLWGRFWDCPAVSSDLQSQLCQLRQRLHERVERIGPEVLDFGLIHADAVRENVMISEQGVGLIDFDDCGYGFRLFELATALLRNRVEPNYADLEAALIRGYRSQRALGEEALALLPVFIVLRSLTYIGWAASRPEMAHKAEPYAADALELAEQLL
jgi:Ser/Thr protein kinase RdoA (MazF antagonist)